MKQFLISIICLVLLGLVFVIPVIPSNLVLNDDLPVLVIEGNLTPEDVILIEREARGGSFVSLVEVLNGTVNQPFSYISEIEQKDIPYPSSIKSHSDVVIGHGWYKDSMSGGGYKVFLKKTEDGWVVIGGLTYLI